MWCSGAAQWCATVIHFCVYIHKSQWPARVVLWLSFDCVSYRYRRFTQHGRYVSTSSRTASSCTRPNLRMPRTTSRCSASGFWTIKPLLFPKSLTSCVFCFVSFLPFPYFSTMIGDLVLHTEEPNPSYPRSYVTTWASKTDGSLDSSWSLARLLRECVLGVAQKSEMCLLSHHVYCLGAKINLMCPANKRYRILSHDDFWSKCFRFRMQITVWLNMGYLRFLLLSHIFYDEVMMSYH